jgi:hypothetical protein
LIASCPRRRGQGGAVSAWPGAIGGAARAGRRVRRTRASAGQRLASVDPPQHQHFVSCIRHAASLRARRNAQPAGGQGVLGPAREGFFYTRAEPSVGLFCPTFLPYTIALIQIFSPSGNPHAWFFSQGSYITPSPTPFFTLRPKKAILSNWPFGQDRNHGLC